MVKVKVPVHVGFDGSSNFSGSNCFGVSRHSDYSRPRQIICTVHPLLFVTTLCLSYVLLPPSPVANDLIPEFMSVSSEDTYSLDGVAAMRLHTVGHTSGAWTFLKLGFGMQDPL